MALRLQSVHCSVALPRFISLADDPADCKHDHRLYSPPPNMDGLG
jgi:hypothetical protein